MYWVISGPSDNPLTGTIILKQGQTAWEQIAPYLPVLTALVSVVGIGMTCLLANRAREIATQQKKIAEDKLEIDAFDKIYNVVLAYDKFFTILLTPALTKQDIKSGSQDFLVYSTYYHIFFSNNLHHIFRKTSYLLSKLADFRDENLDFELYSAKKVAIYDEKVEEINEELRKIKHILKIFLPDILKRKSYPPISTIFPASPDKPQPTAPATDQSPPTP
ncbi:hypothetical protein GOB83_11505 [Acetobacter fabarum]|uniref:hypothetical protein n=1 Tax=Acetobacter fabarum TaxID=483199 RepID=UPI0014048160|nr:hypothetical protein [Acetobacter fabarum]NHO42797.1 hypothetical protein [Acetobacter fabarum]